MIVEDHQLIIEGLCRLFDMNHSFEVVCVAKKAEEARLFMRNNEVDLIIMDIQLPHKDGKDSGLELTKELITLYPDLIILINSQHAEVEFVRRAMEAGARGYLLKGSDISIIRSAIDTVIAGNIYFDPNLPERPKPIPHGQTLTAKEKEVMKLIAQWETNEKIAEKLGIKITGLNSHRCNIMYKLGLSNAIEVLHEAIKRYGDLNNQD